MPEEGERFCATWKNFVSGHNINSTIEETGAVNVLRSFRDFEHDVGGV